MSASKHTIYLTKNSTIDDENANVFLFNENGRGLTTEWVSKTLNNETTSAVILDNKKVLYDSSAQSMKNNGCAVNQIIIGEGGCPISINPYDLVTNSSETHFLFLNLLYAVWDNNDQDILAMSNLIDAFATCVLYMFDEESKKRTMKTLKGMAASIRKTLVNGDGEKVPMYGAILTNNPDDEWMPKKYYKQFVKASGERQAEIAEKVALFFDMFGENDVDAMSSTDEALLNAFNGNTVFFISPDEEKREPIARTTFVLFYYLRKKMSSDVHSLFLIDKLCPTKNFISLPHWLKTADDENVSFIVCSNNIAEYDTTPRLNRFFTNMIQNVTASLMIHKNDEVAQYYNGLTFSESEDAADKKPECIGTIIIPDKSIVEQDEVF